MCLAVRLGGAHNSRDGTSLLGAFEELGGARNSRAGCGGGDGTSLCRWQCLEGSVKIRRHNADNVQFKLPDLQKAEKNTITVLAFIISTENKNKLC